MATKVLSIEVGERITKVIEMDFGVKTPKLYNAFTFETPRDTLNDEGVNVNENMISLMRQGLSQNGIRTNKVVFTISSSRIANRDVTIPTVKDAKIKQLLIANSRDYFPVDLSEYELVYRVTERVKEAKQIKLSVFAVPRGLIASYKQLAKAWGLQIQGMDYSGNSVHQAMLHMMNPALAVTICVNEKNSILTVVKDGKVELQRTVAYGIDDAVDVVRNSKDIQTDGTYMQAFNMLRDKGCFNQQLQEDPDMDDWDDLEDQEIMDIRAAVTKSMTMLIGNLSRVLDYYTSRNTEVTIDKVQLIGLGSECRGLDKLLSNELGVSVMVLRDYKGVSVGRSLSRTKFKLAEYMVAVGAVFEPLNFAMEAQGGAKGKGGAKEKKDSMALPVLLLVGGLVAAAVVVVIPFSKNMELELENASMRTEIQQKQSVVQTYNDYLYLKKTYEGLTVANQNTGVPNDAFLDFLKEMEERMPKDFKVETLSVAEDVMTISAMCTTKASVAEALIQLRTFDTVLDVSCSGVVEEENDAGAIEERFDITLTYTPPAVETEAEETEAMAETAEE